MRNELRKGDGNVRIARKISSVLADAMTEVEGSDRIPVTIRFAGVFTRRLARALRVRGLEIRSVDESRRTVAGLVTKVEIPRLAHLKCVWKIDVPRERSL